VLSSEYIEPLDSVYTYMLPCIMTPIQKFIIREAESKAANLIHYVFSAVQENPGSFTPRGLHLFENYIKTAIQYLKSPMTLIISETHHDDHQAGLSPARDTGEDTHVRAGTFEGEGSFPGGGTTSSGVS